MTSLVLEFALRFCISSFLLFSNFTFKGSKKLKIFFVTVSSVRYFVLMDDIYWCVLMSKKRKTQQVVFFTKPRFLKLVWCRKKNRDRKRRLPKKVRTLPKQFLRFENLLMLSNLVNYLPYCFLPDHVLFSTQSNPCDDKFVRACLHLLFLYRYKLDNIFKNLCLICQIILKMSQKTTACL